MEDDQECVLEIEDIKFNINKLKKQAEEIDDQISVLEKLIADVQLTEIEVIWKRVVILNQGDSFGELALIDSRSGKRAARIVCTQDCYMGVIAAQDYHKTLSKIENKKRDKMIEFIRQMPYFRSLTSLKIKGLINSLQKVEFARGNIVIKEGTQHQEDDVYFVIEGEFAEIQTFNLEDNQIDSMSKEQQQNRDFHKSQEKQFLIQQNLELQSVQS